MRARPPAPCSFVPPHVLERLGRYQHVAHGATTQALDLTAIQRTAVISTRLREQRVGTRADVATLARAIGAPEPGKSARRVYDCRRGWEFDAHLARDEGADPVGTPASVDLAYDHVGETRDWFAAVLERSGIDNLGSDIVVNANFGQDFGNAFWDGTRIVFGTGDGVVFSDFSASLDVAGHEMTHGVVQYTAGLEYQSQSGALNEHFADVAGSLVEQRAQGLDAGTANWLIGDEIMAPDLYGEALRSMAHPGTAYDNPVLGKDPQPAHMDDYFAGPEDNQGVHINSGIPNRAFYLAAMEIGSEPAGRIWFAALARMGPTATFLDAARIVCEQARVAARDGVASRQAAQAVRAAWRAVGVL